MLGIAVMTLIGIFYTLFGGVRSVIWTDVIQTVIFTSGAALAAVIVLMHRIPLNLGQIIDALKNPGAGLPSKLTLLKLHFDGFGPKDAYTLLTAGVLFHAAGIWEPTALTRIWRSG